jgi:hypothetical protein
MSVIPWNQLVSVHVDLAGWLVAANSSCPRSVTLYILDMGEHPGLTHREEQRTMVHLQACGKCHQASS